MLIRKLIVIVLVVFASCKHADEIPKIKIINSKIDIGTVVFGHKKSFNIFIENAGESDLIIKKIQPSCKCILNDERKENIIKSKDTLKISLTYFANEVGSTEESIVVLSNAKEKFNFIKVKANVKNE